MDYVTFLSKVIIFFTTFKMIEYINLLLLLTWLLLCLLQTEKDFLSHKYSNGLRNT